MKPLVLFSHNYLLALVFLFGLFDVLISEVNCNLRYLRYMYMVSCGMKKRSSDFPINESLLKEIPLDFEEAVEYLKNHRKFHPLTKENMLLYEIFLGSENSSEEEITKNTSESPIAKSTSIILKTLGKKPEKNEKKSWLGIPGFPLDWDVHEILESGEAKINGRRELDQLINECCRSRNRTCDESTFTSACK